MKKNKGSKNKFTSKELFDVEKPKYNGYICGYGAHGDKKYNRRKEKKKFQVFIDELSDFKDF